MSDPSRPPSAPAAGGRPGLWAAGLATVALLLGSLEASLRPPPPGPATLPGAAFSEARALPVVQRLEAIGTRVAGSPGQRAAADALEATLRGIPGVEVERQRVDGVKTSGGASFEYRVENVLARLPGRVPGGVLVAAHYDSPPESVGAADDGVGVGAAVELLRALAAGPRLEHAVVLCLDGAEETASLGATGCARHPWVEEVRAFLNVDAAGTRGKAFLFQAGPGNGWLARAYARTAPRPFGSVFGQDIFQSGLVPSGTSFATYAGEARPGLDLALVRDGYAYHTHLDRVAHLEPGSLQHLGDNLLAVVRGLARGPLPAAPGGAPAVYYDLLGQVMVAYSRPVANLLAVLALGLAGGVLALGVRRGALTLRGTAAAAGVSLAGVLLGLLAAGAGALSLGYLLGRPHGWFSAPWLAATAFGGLALSGMLLAHALWERRSRRRGLTAGERGLASWGGGLLLWALALGLATLAGLGSAYLALWWLAAGTLALAAALRAPRLGPGLLLVAFLGAGLATLPPIVVLFELFVPIAGRLPLPFPFDPLIAAIAALPVLGCGVLGVAVAQFAGSTGRASGAVAAVGLLALAAAAWRFPYSPDCPKRVTVEQRDEDGASRLLLTGEDFPALGPALSGLPGAHPSSRAGEAGFYEAPATPSGVAPTQVTVLSVRDGPRPGERRVSLRLESPASSQLTLRIPRTALAGWSVTEALPSLEADEEQYTLVWVPSPHEARELTLRLTGAGPVRLEAEESFPDTTPELTAARARLPSWTAPATRLVHVAHVDL